MERDTRPQDENRQNTAQQSTNEKVKNPFENHQSAEDDVRQSEEELEKEQQFKEAMTERD